MQATMIAPEPSDELLMDRYCAGDTAAFTSLFRRYGRRVVRFLTPYVGPTHAEDCAQQAFLKVHQSRSRFRVGARVAPWLFAIARNVALDHLRSAPHRREHADGDEHATAVAVPAHEADPRLNNAVRAALLALPDDQRDVVTLHWLGGLSFPEVGVVVGASHEAVRARATRAYEALRQHLGELARELTLPGAPT